MAASSVSHPSASSWESGLLRVSIAAFESSLLYLLLASLARPREGAALLLPLASSLALLAGLTTHRLLEATTVGDTARQAAGALTSLGWALGAARLVAPAGYWEADAGRGLLLFGSIFGGQPSVGLQPLAFWTSLLFWLRGHFLPIWDPSVDEVLARFRFGCLFALIVVLFGASADGPGTSRSVQIEQAAAAVAFLLTSLLMTGLARRREMAGGAPAAPTLSGQSGASRPASLTPLAVAAGVTLVLALAAAAASSISPTLLEPALWLGGLALMAGANALGSVVGWLGGHWPTLPTPPPAQDAPPTLDLSSWLPHFNFTPPAWLGAALFWLLLACLCAMALLLLSLAHRTFLTGFDRGLNAVVGDRDEPRPSSHSNAPTTVLAILVRFLRTFLPQTTTLVAAPHSQSDYSPEPAQRSMREIYRAFLAWSATHGCPRRLADTPDELLLRLAAARPSSAVEATRLTDLYVRVRYGRQSCTVEELREAESALARLSEHAAIAAEHLPPRSTRVIPSVEPKCPIS